MAYLDDNNDNLYTRGDPLEALDSELAELKATLGALDTDRPAQEQPAPPVIPAEDPVPAPVPDAPKPNALSAETKEHDSKMRRYREDKPRNGKKSRLPLILLSAVLAAAVIAGIGYTLMRVLLPSADDENTAPTAGGEVVTINDSVMGDIELQTVKGARVNTKTAENLGTDENGYPAYYEDGEKISHLGIDLSEYQGDVDFAALRQAGVEFVMLRIGGRFYGENGTVYEDGAFDSYYEQAKAAGLKVGAYFFSQAISTGDAVEEANFALDKLNGRALDYPVAFDWENIADDEARTDNVTGDVLTLMAEAFCDTITDGGYKAIVYSNAQQMFILYDFETMKNYDFWLADYRDFPSMYYNYDMWQYTMTGTVDGVEGEVDLNLSFTDFT